MSSDCGSTVYTQKANYLKYGDHATGLVSDLTYRIGEKSVDREKYSYDAEGNISAIHENGKLKVRYTYDSLNRLIREDNSDFKLTTTFAYDNGDNIIRQNECAFSLAPTDELADGTELVYEYGNEYRPDQLTSFKGKEITYDANGCPTSYLDNKCSFTRGTLLSEYEKYDSKTQKYITTTFRYDADGIRTEKGNITFTYIDGKLIRQEGGIGGKLDFIYGASGIIGFKHNNNTIYWYRRNLMGDVTHIYNMSGKLCAKYVYDAWGNHKVVDASGNETTDKTHIGNINPIRYRGYYYDVETELYYLQTRYYDPETGRFISQDDISYLDPESINGLNLYAYCGNNPVMGYDPNGCDWKSFWNSTWGKIIGTTLVVVAVIALSIATAGVGTAVAGALGGGFWAAIAGGAVGGAISGAIFGTGISVISQGVTNGYSNIDYGKVAIDGLIGVVSGAVSGAIFAGIGRGLGLLGKTKWAQRTLSKFDDASKNYMFGSKSGNFTFLRNGKAFRLEASLQHGLHYHSFAAGTTASQWELIFKISNLIAGALGERIGNALY